VVPERGDNAHDIACQLLEQLDSQGSRCVSFDQASLYTQLPVDRIFFYIYHDIYLKQSEIKIEKYQFKQYKVEEGMEKYQIAYVVTLYRNEWLGLLRARIARPLFELTGVNLTHMTGG
jgi:hypothetical protein